MPEGTDISEYQDHVPDCEFVIIRGWSGYRQDNRFTAHWAEAKAKGIPRGVYGYVVGANPAAQAASLVALVAPDPPELGYWSDIEEPGLSHDAALGHINALRVTGANGYYSNVPDYTGILQSDPSLNDLYWWVAGYGPNDGQRHPLNPVPPRPYLIHQYTSYPNLDRNYAETLDWFGTTPQPEEHDMFILKGPTGAAYISDGPTKRYIGNPDELNMWGGAGVKEIVATQAQLDLIPDWAPPSGGSNTSGAHTVHGTFTGTVES